MKIAVKKQTFFRSIIVVAMTEGYYRSQNREITNPEKIKRIDVSKARRMHEKCHAPKTPFALCNPA